MKELIHSCSILSLSLRSLFRCRQIKLEEIFIDLRRNNLVPRTKSLLFVSLVALGVGFLTPCSIESQTVNFHRQIRPLLSKNCFACHGPDEKQRAADLRLDLRAGVFGDGGDGKIVEPGKPQESELYLRITSSDASEKMPPPKATHQLSQDDVALIKSWIEQGAKWESHWAYIPIPRKMSIPDYELKNPIDRFVAQRLDKAGLSFSPSATKRELIRRVSLDLTGLPPTPGEIKTYLDDHSPNAFEKVVDRLLASRHFGERMALAWLDQARYADTNGYSIDGGRHMWLWRDWVIHAYNENMPFDQFLREQLAGDLLPNATESQKIASGFNRNHMITHEGGTISAENLVNYTVDRVKTTSEVFLGLTMGCAQCHDHKYDPISQKDFYRFFAFFNSLDDRGLDGNAGRNSTPHIKVKTVLPMESKASLEKELLALRRLMEKAYPSQAAWEKQALEELGNLGRGFKATPCEVIKVTDPNAHGAFRIVDEGKTVFVPGPRGRSPSISAKLPIDNVTALRLEFLPDDRFPEKGIGHGRQKGNPGNLVLSAFHASATKLMSTQVDPFRELRIKRATASASSAKFPPRNVLDGRDSNGWSPSPNLKTKQSITLELAAPIGKSNTPYVTVMLVWGGGGLGRGDLVGGKYQLLAISGNNDQTDIPEQIQTLLKIPSGERSNEQATALRRYYNSIAPELANIRYQISNLEERIRVVSDAFEVMVMNQSTKPRKTFVLSRGQYDQPLDEVFAGLPGVIDVPGYDSGKEKMNRLDLANWMTHSDHPLTSRVAVNRIWQLLFGTGFVATSADFGSQGEFPSHPELLDYLARDFIDNQWDTKRLIRQIVLSKTYQQSARSNDRLNRLDPQNRLLSRGPRFRLQAEMIRDLTLYTSGLLSDRKGGPSVQPYQPPGLWKEVSHYGSTPATSQIFVQHHGEKLYRKSMYTYWKRTAPPPSLTVFDAPNREVCTVRRSITNTPLQALVLLNDPQFIEASRALAARMIGHNQELSKQIEFGFEVVLGRRPAKREMEILMARFKSELQEFEKDNQAAHSLLQIGEANVGRGNHPPQHAAMTVVANLIYNMSETITR